MFLMDASATRRTSRTIIFLVLLAASARLGSTQAIEPKSVNAAQAEILVYVSPAGTAVRARGADIGMEEQTSASLNQRDYFYFWVYDSGSPTHGSATVGYYAVNKHTADVWDTVEDRRLSSTQLAGVQKIIRATNHISQDVIDRYRSEKY